MSTVLSPTRPRPTTSSTRKVRTPTSPDSKVRIEEATSLRSAMDVFEATGISAPPSIPPSSSRTLPEPSQLSLRTELNINGEPQLQIVRTDPIAGTKDKEITVVAVANDLTKGTAAFPNWLATYKRCNYPDRTRMLGITDWAAAWQHETSQILLDIEAGRLINGRTVNPGLALSPTGAAGVLTGKSEDTDRKRVTWFGHSGFSLARRLGAMGCTGAEAVATFDALQIPMGKTAIIGGCYAGKSGKRGEPANITADQEAILQSIIDKVRAARSTADTKEAPAKATAGTPVVVLPSTGKAPTPTVTNASIPDHLAELAGPNPPIKPKPSTPSARELKDRAIMAEVAKRRAAKARGSRKGK